MEDHIVKCETYKYLLSLRRQYLNLPHESFPCNGSITIWKIINYLIDKLIERISLYSIRQVRLINSLLPEFDYLCGILDNSAIKNVPWSILPSLESLFAQILTGAKFVICPQWEINYGVSCTNLVEYIHKSIISLPGLIFDAGTDFHKNISDFLNKFDKEVYMLLYPRSERLTVLHFPLLGHEIGHIYANQWILQNFNTILDKHQIEQKVKGYISSNIPVDIQNTLFERRHIIERYGEIIEIYGRVISEFISDLVGGLIFGPTALLSTYIFALKFGYDDTKSIEKGYLPWRFRMYFIEKILERIGTITIPKQFAGAILWMKEISRISNMTDFDAFFNEPKNKRYEYLKFFMDMIQSDFNSIVDEILKLVPHPHYSDVQDKTLQNEVVNRLSHGIVPNCVMDKDLNESPIDFRNIVGGTWYFLCDKDPKEYLNFSSISRTANLLSLKAIELSHLQSDH